MAAAEAKTTAASVSEAYPTDATTVAVPAEAYPAEPTTTPPPPPPEANPYEQPVVAEPEDKNRVHGMLFEDTGFRTVPTHGHA